MLSDLWALQGQADIEQIKEIIEHQYGCRVTDQYATALLSFITDVATQYHVQQHVNVTVKHVIERILQFDPDSTGTLLLRQDEIVALRQLLNTFEGQ